MGIKPGVFEWAGWVLLTEFLVNDLYLTHEGEYTDEDVATVAGWGLSTGLLIGTTTLISRIGTWPVAAITAIYLAGKWISQGIGGNEGRDDYYGFMSGGIYGNEPNYGVTWGTPNFGAGSGGYFDIAGNIALILTLHNKHKNEKITYSNEADFWTSYGIMQDYINIPSDQKAGGGRTMTDMQFNTYLVDNGLITYDEWSRRYWQSRKQAEEANSAKAAREQARKKWKELSPNQQKGIVNAGTELRNALNFW